MTFLDLVLVFVGFALAVLVGAALVGRVRGEHLRAVAATLVALWALTAVFDNVMIAVDLFRFDESQLSGIHVGLAPLEDFAWPVAAATALPALALLLSPDDPRATRGTRR